MATKMSDVVAFVTGGASGIGRALVERVIKQGGKAVIVDLTDDGKKFAAGLGGNATFVKADVTSEEDIKKALDHAKQRFGGINVVINCAGILVIGAAYDFKSKTAHPLETYKKIMDVNALGTFNVTRLAAGLMAENAPDESQQRGVIINISSIMADDCTEMLLAYAISKAAVRGMTIPFARCFAEKGIRVVTISPGYTSTPMTSYYENDPVSKALTDSFLLTPKRYAKPDEIAHLAQCIIENSYINATNITISAGYSYSQSYVQN